MTFSKNMFGRDRTFEQSFKQNMIDFRSRHLSGIVEGYSRKQEKKENKSSHD